LSRQVPLAGLIALSTYLPDAASAQSRLQPAAKAQPVFMAHGSADPVIPLRYAEQSASKLRELGFALEWHDYPMAHQVCAEEIHALGNWMTQRFAAA
jgi:phospholipase/carboxylesterase